MFEKNTSDLHCHLNGSFSLPFLYKVAGKNGRLDEYTRLVELRESYLIKTKEQPADGFAEEDVKLVWEQFALIHKIIQTLDDIHLGTIDVIRNSLAKYLEIRTTPKGIDKKSREEYITAFEQGLIDASLDSSIEKKAFGLLSLDRTYHSLEVAKEFMARVTNSREGVLKGIDICGNPLSSRTLRGDDLKQLIDEALNRNIGLTIHMGEADTEIERQDTDTILTALEKWVEEYASQKEKPLHGKVRLGHCIFLTESQKVRIRKLNIPIEVCPTCHSKLNWHLENSPHPVTDIYSDLSEAITFATDDEIIFGASIKDELRKGLRFFTNRLNLTLKEIKANQAQFRF
ncbi:hypothetical protein [Legionella micdadei]|uniref:hypothetical protein n=1 Tax=Legionella micdadei TaxID=451 RepID=UPI0009EF77E5|nr:hypothetical protein [Legionella micdadei]ARH00404.1 hypothetical protein B6V88_08190 [Legionella micdadei]